MALIIPHTKPAFWPAPRPGSFAASIRKKNADGCQLALLGLPDDTGVKLNRGRSGAAGGPAAFRRVLAGFGYDHDGAGDRALRVGVFDAGDVTVAPDDSEPALAANHDRIRQAVEAVHRLGMLPLCVGGGHDLTYASVSALSASLAASGSRPGGINLDAHLDVRETAGSGMAFRALIERGVIAPQRFVALGVNPFANSLDHLRWLRDRGSLLVPVETVLQGSYDLDDVFARAFPDTQCKGFVTICLDAIDGAQAPGVSAVNPLGVPVAFALELARTAGRHPAVRHFDLMELAPNLDQDDRTARVAALLFLGFISGYCQRPGFV